jgi:hypothetical protein
MKKSYKVVRVANGKVKWEESIELKVEMAERIAESCERRRGGYVLNEKVLAELLGCGVDGKYRFVLFALLIEVLNGRLIVVFV